jgi:N6-L-threonylcarbamoyladenine synthase
MSSKLIPGLENVCGGAAIEILARGGLISAFPFSPSMSHYMDCNFSFSGIFMNFLQHMKRLETKFSKAFDVHHQLWIKMSCPADLKEGDILPGLEDLCASYQYAVTKHMCQRLQRGMEYVNRKNLIPQANKSFVIFFTNWFQ